MSKEHVFDKIGQAISTEDKIVYGRSTGDDIHFGTVVEVYPDRKAIKVRNDVTKRVSVNFRAGNEVLVVTYLKDIMPEYFI